MIPACFHLLSDGQPAVRLVLVGKAGKHGVFGRAWNYRHTIQEFFEVCKRLPWIESGKKQCDEFSCYVRGLVLYRIQTMWGHASKKSSCESLRSARSGEVDRTWPKRTSAMEWK